MLFWPGLDYYCWTYYWTLQCLHFWSKWEHFLCATLFITQWWQQPLWPTSWKTGWISSHSTPFFSSIIHNWGFCCLNGWVVRLPICQMPICLFCKGFNQPIHQKKAQHKGQLNHWDVGHWSEDYAACFYINGKLHALLDSFHSLHFLREANRSSKDMRFISGKCCNKDVTHQTQIFSLSFLSIYLKRLWGFSNCFRLLLTNTCGYPSRTVDIFKTLFLTLKKRTPNKQNKSVKTLRPK